MKLGIIGTGKNWNSIGISIARELAQNKDITEVYIWNRTQDRCDWAREQILQLKDPPKVFIETPERIAEYTDLSIICTEQNEQLREDARDRKIKNREQMLWPNLPIIRQLGKRFSSYKGKVLVVTNPTDILAYAFCAEANLDPLQVYGFNHVDAYRLSRACQDVLSKKEIKGKVQSYVLGPHGPQMIPIFSQCYLSPLKVPINQLLKLEERQEINKKVRKAGFVNMIKWDTVAGEVASAMRESIETLLGNSTEPVCLSTFFRLSDYTNILEKAEVQNLEELLEGEDKGCFIGYPVTKSGLLERFQLEAEEAKEFVGTYVELHKTMAQLIQEKKVPEIKYMKAHTPIIEVQISERRKIDLSIETTKQDPKQQMTVSEEALSFPDIYCVNTLGDIFLLHVEKKEIETIRKMGISTRSLHRKEGLLYLGTREGIISLSENVRDDLEDIRVNRYDLPKDLKPTDKGINSIAVTKENIYGSHSKLGVCRWRRDNKGELINLNLPTNGVTRAVLLDQDRLYYGSGNSVYTMDTSGSVAKEIFSGSGEMYALGTTKEFIYALFSDKKKGKSLSIFKKGEKLRGNFPLSIRAHDIAIEQETGSTFLSTIDGGLYEFGIDAVPDKIYKAPSVQGKHTIIRIKDPFLINSWDNKLYCFTLKKNNLTLEQEFSFPETITDISF